jgi:beta-lactamase class A
MGLDSDKFSIRNLLRIKIPLYIFALTIAIIASSFYWIHAKSSEVLNQSSSSIEEIHGGNCVVQLIRENKDGLIRPLLLTNLDQEDPALIPLKQNILSFIEQEKLAGIIKSASVYVRMLNNGNWMSINEAEAFSPGSLMKVPTLITILKDAETNPAILEKKILFKKHFSSIPSQTKTGAALVEGTTYKVKELLEYMILYSDNDATALLNNTLNFDIMVKLFEDLKLQEPNYTQQDYLIGSSDYSRFLRVLFNASYLNAKNSEYALQLLSRSAYKEGLIKYTDSTVTVAHKFGERNNNGEQQLHEFGIYYINNNPYLIGVMTKGSDYKLLPEVISGVSKIVFDAVTDKQKITS